MKANMDGYITALHGLKSLWRRAFLLKHSFADTEEGAVSEGDSPIDMAVFRQAIGDDLDFEKQLVSLYLEQTSIQMNDLKLAFEQADRNAVERIAHKAAGSSYAFGAIRLAPVLRELEQSTHGGAELGHLLPLLQKASAEHEVLKTFLGKRRFAAFSANAGG